MTGPAGSLQHEKEHLDALQRMRALESYYRWAFDLVRPWLGSRILDAGCGVGNFTVLAAEVAESVVAIDLSADNLEVLRQRLPGVETLQVDLEADDQVAALGDQPFDTVVCLDVLEHMDRDVDVMRRFHGIVKPGGHLAVKVPACPRLYGSIDVASDHRRRYSRRQLETRAREAGWTPIRTRYMNIWGVVPYWIKSRLLKRSATFSQTFTRRQLAVMAAVVPVLQRLDRLIGPPIGQSAILVARKD